MFAFDEQSSIADWPDSVQFLSETDNAPMWTTVPTGLVATLNIFPEGSTTASISATSTDASGMIEAFPNGFVNINVPAASMATLAPDNHNVVKRNKVFVKVTEGGVPMQLLVAILPVYLGA